MIASTKVLIRMGKQWCPVGTATLEDDAGSGVRMLRLDLTAMAPQLYLPLRDILAAEVDISDSDDDEPLTLPSCVGHA